MEHSKLSEHKLIKGKFITPWHELMRELNKEESWFYGRLPEYFWIALIINYYGRETGLKKSYEIIINLHKLVPNLYSPRLSSILNLDKILQQKFYDAVLVSVVPDALAPLTAIFTHSEFPIFAKAFCVPELSVADRVRTITTVLGESSDHQSHLSTDIRFVALFFTLLSGRIKMPKNMIDRIVEYPQINHDDEKMKIIRPTIRSAEMIQLPFESPNETFINHFWEDISRMTDCELYMISYDEADIDAECYMTNVKTALSYYSELMNASRPLDNQMIVLLSIATYSYKRLLEVVNHQLYYTIAGRSILRGLIENFIMMKYLIIEEKNHDDIWTEYQYYGIGHYKLVAARISENGNLREESHVNHGYLGQLVNEYKSQEFIDMDTSYFDKKTIREKFSCVDEKELYCLYDYDTAYEHGLWGAIRESTLLKCMSPAHQYHCVPDIDNKQNLKSIWSDCVDIMDRTLSILEELFGSPMWSSKEVNRIE